MMDLTEYLTIGIINTGLSYYVGKAFGKLFYEECDPYCLNDPVVKRMFLLGVPKMAFSVLSSVITKASPFIVGADICAFTVGLYRGSDDSSVLTRGYLGSILMNEDLMDSLDLEDSGLVVVFDDEGNVK